MAPKCDCPISSWLWRYPVPVGVRQAKNTPTDGFFKVTHQKIDIVFFFINLTFRIFNIYIKGDAQYGAGTYRYLLHDIGWVVDYLFSHS